MRDPSGCGLAALQLCEVDPPSFDAAYSILTETASGVNSGLLFSMARYLEHRGHFHKAYNMAALATRGVMISYTQEGHQAVLDIYWTVVLAKTLGRTQLAQLVPVLVKNIQCATVLSDILKKMFKQFVVYTSFKNKFKQLVMLF